MIRSAFTGFVPPERASTVPDRFPQGQFASVTTGGFMTTLAVHPPDVQPPESAANLQKVTIADAARLMNVSPRLVALARIVRRFGIPELIALVDNGKLAVSAAAPVVRLP